jgi:hypothetical protein
MGVLREWRCSGHGEFESEDNVCPTCGHAFFVKQEIRTAPAYQRKNMKIIDGIFRGIAQDNGLTDLKNDPKAGVSVLEAMKKMDDISKPRWGPVEHAKPGFSRDKDATVPTITAESMGYVPTAAANMKFPPMRGDGTFNNSLAKTEIHGRYKGE